MTIVPNSPLVFQYLNLLPLGARGGVTRFFMLSQGIDFSEQLIAMSDWPAVKKRLVESGQNPAGSLPILYSTNSHSDNNKQQQQQQQEQQEAHPQHIAVCRYLARIHGVTANDEYKDYVQDLVADEYQGFRDAWVKATFSSTDAEKDDYTDKALPAYLTKLNALYETFATTDTFLSLSAKTMQPLWGDAAVYGLLRDHVLTKYMTTADLAASYPRLAKMYAAYEAIPAVQAWLETLDRKE